MFLGAAAGVLIAAWMAAYFSGRQPSVVALDVGISIVRIFFPFILVLLVQELFFKEFERRYFLGSLSYPGERVAVLLGRFFSAFVLIFAGLFGVAFLLGVMVWGVGEIYGVVSPVDLWGGYAVTVLFIAVDFLLLTALAVFLSTIASVSGFILIGTLGFMVVARSFAPVLELLMHDASVVANAENYRAGVGVLGYLLPDLSALDVRMVALYGRFEFLPGDWLIMVLSILAYTSSLLALAIFSLNRKRFV